jgi:hypothetical protein
MIKIEKMSVYPNIKYSLKDISIVPAAVSSIDSRSQCKPYTDEGMLPLFTAPMSSVVSLENYKLFEKSKIHPIIPRNIDFETRKDMCSQTWCAFSLKEFEDLFCTGYIIDYNKRYVLIDIANGNMLKLHGIINLAKSTYGNNLVIMAGNVANPETYEALSNAGCDYVRCSVGTGFGCITASNTGIFYPSASLIRECYEISLNLNNPAYIVADGGVRNYDDVIKYLALGADYVMVGSVFGKMLESAGETKIMKHGETKLQMDLNPFNGVNQYSVETLNDFKRGVVLVKSYYGMSTKRAQKELGNTILKTSEGIEKQIEVEYTMSQWVENFTDYLRSAMSYTNSRTLENFIGNVQIALLSNSAQESFNR